jgi:hypothetical protein
MAYHEYMDENGKIVRRHHNGHRYASDDSISDYVSKPSDPVNVLAEMMGPEFNLWSQTLPFRVKYNSAEYRKAVLQKIAELTEHIEDDVDHADLLDTQKSAIM